MMDTDTDTGMDMADAGHVAVVVDDEEAVATISTPTNNLIVDATETKTE